MVKMSKFPYNHSGMVLVCRLQRPVTRKASTRLRAPGLASLIPKMTPADLSYDYNCLRSSPDESHAGVKLNREHHLQCCRLVSVDPTKPWEMIKPSTATELRS